MEDHPQESFFTRLSQCRTPRDRRNVSRYTLLLAAWAVLFVGSTFLIKTGRVGAGPAAWLVVGLTSLMALLAMLAYWRYQCEADELARKIELQALALAVCVGFVSWSTVKLLERMDVLVDPLTDAVLLLMIGAYVFGNIRGWMRYV